MCMTAMTSGEVEGEHGGPRAPNTFFVEGTLFPQISGPGGTVVTQYSPKEMKSRTPPSTKIKNNTKFRYAAMLQTMIPTLLGELTMLPYTPS